MILIDELPFRSVEHEGFRKFMQEAQPYFKIPSPVTRARYFMFVFNNEKMKLKSLLSINKHKVSIATNTWTSIQNVNCVIAHYIDIAFRLQKKILDFSLIANHKGEIENTRELLKTMGD